MALSLPLAAVVDQLLATYTDAIPLDAIGSATAAVTGRADDIDAVVAAIEAAGRTVEAPVGGPTARGPALLATVLKTARALQITMGRTPSPLEVARAAGLEEAEVRHALGFARVLAK